MEPSSLLANTSRNVGQAAKFTGVNLIQGAVMAVGAICAVALARKFLPALVKNAMGEETPKTT